jgi:hypothetical protein
MVRGSGASPPTGTLRDRSRPSLDESGLVRSGVARGPTGRTRYPGLPIDDGLPGPEHGRMELIQPSHHARRPSMAPLVGGTVLGTVLVVAGIVLA